MIENRLRDLMKQGKPTIGTRVLSSWPGIIEVLGQTGAFDYVEFLAEYGPWSLYDLENIARAAELCSMSSMIKIDAVPRSYIAAKALASGIQNFLFADIRTVEDAKEAVRSERSEPDGLMGIGDYRVGGYVFTRIPISSYRKACDEAVIAFMIEKRSAVENLKEILSVKGVDMVQFGPWDYGLSIGLGREDGSAWSLSHPKVKEAELYVIKTALDMGKHPRVELMSLDSIQEYLDLGVRDFNIGAEHEILYSWWKEKGDTVRKLLSKLER